MDMKLFFTAFSAVFFAELADKTQLVGIVMASKSGRPLTVWMGSVAAYIIITAVSVVLGAILSKYMRPEIVKYAAGAIFIIMGVLMVAGKI
ncbi:MAG: TMEM165/GDT1 family protein [Candidatus Omnitrophica bacterium]|nr:TMEM165/GDT1 family protein [Candidatus Omnitrophota bacterium]MDD5487845.1 TMEM165/GDT1 family protein [Candidatus Omnitrophota bacterium]